MNKCACGEALAGQMKVCFACQKRNKLERKRELRRAKSEISWLYKVEHLAKPKRPALREPISDARQREIDAEIDRAAEIRIHLNPLDPRAISTIRPAIWLWQ